LSGLPQGWVKVPIAELFEFKYGKGPLKKSATMEKSMFMGLMVLSVSMTML